MLPWQASGADALAWPDMRARTLLARLSSGALTPSATFKSTASNDMDLTGGRSPSPESAGASGRIKAVNADTVQVRRPTRCCAIPRGWQKTLRVL